MAILFSIRGIMWSSQTIHLVFDISEMSTETSVNNTSIVCAVLCTSPRGLASISGL